MYEKTTSAFLENTAAPATAGLRPASAHLAGAARWEKDTAVLSQCSKVLGDAKYRLKNAHEGRDVSISFFMISVIMEIT